jgi:hypothetical protein
MKNDRHRQVALSNDSMWCFHCERDVAVRPVGGETACARCGGLVGGSGQIAGLVPSAAFEEADGPTVWNDWSVDFEIARAELALESSRYVERGERDPVAMPLQALATPARTATNNPAPPDGAARQPRPGGWAWSALLLGVMGLSCGAVLVGCSFMPGRGSLWNAGLPVLLAGQVVLLLGLLLQIERVWHNSRWAGRRLEDVDQRIEELNRSAAMWTTTASPSAMAFYHHLAHGASPHILLADLKGQMDLLAQRTAASR